MAGIMVAGGGIAGSAAALALHKAGFEVVVYEAHPDSGADIGAFLTLAGNGMRALAQFDAAEAVAARGFALTTMRVLDAAGAQLAAAPLGEHQDPLTRYRCMRRAELAAALHGELRRRGIPVRHGARLAEAEETEAGVVAGFEDGSLAVGALLIGADGLNSATRARIDPAAEPRYAGQRVFYGYTRGYVPGPDAPEATDRITFVRGNTAVFGYLVSPDRETFWFARVAGPPATDDEIAVTTPRRWREQLLELLADDGGPAADIVASTGSQLMVTNAMDLEPGTRWRLGRVLLLGDAAHAASPATGQGASMALEDAVVLAKALREAARGGGAAVRDEDGAEFLDIAALEPGALDAALERYEAHRRPRAERNIAASARLTAGSAAVSAAPAPGPARPQSDDSGTRADEELIRLLDWDAPLPAVAGQAS